MLLAVGCGFALAGVLQVGVSSAWVVSGPVAVNRPVISSRNDDEEEASDLPELQVLASRSRRRLQRPIVDPAPKVELELVVEPPAVVRLDPPDVQVIGAVIEEGASRAFLRVGSATEVVTEGDVLKELANAELVSVDSKIVTIRYQGELFEFDVPERPAFPGETQ